jgi:hypothetical protein
MPILAYTNCHLKALLIQYDTRQHLDKTICSSKK